MKFKHQDLKDCAQEDESEDGRLHKVKDYFNGSRRWEEDRVLIFSSLDTPGIWYFGEYSIGLTENQDSSWFGYEDEIECPEAEAYQVSITKYRVKT